MRRHTFACLLFLALAIRSFSRAHADAPSPTGKAEGICDVTGGYEVQWKWQGGKCGKKLSLPWSTPFRFQVTEKSTKLSATESPVWAKVDDGLFRSSVEVKSQSTTALCQLSLSATRDIDDVQGFSLDINATLSWKPGEKAVRGGGTLKWQDWDGERSWKCEGKVAVIRGAHTPASGLQKAQ